MTTKVDAKPATAKPAAKAKKAAKKVATLAPSIEATLIQFNHAKAMIKQFETLKDAAQTEIYEALDGADIGLINGVERVSVSHRSGTYINGKLLLEAYPEAYTATAYITPYTVLTTK
jgi:hypothetical protein